MSTIITKIIAFFTAILSFLGIGSYGDKNITYTEPVKVAITDNTVDISFNSNPTTGYEWTFTQDNTVFLYTGGEYVQSATAVHLLGSGGIQHFCFKALTPGTTVATFTYSRSFEPDGEKQQCICTLTADKDLKVTVLWDAAKS